MSKERHFYKQVDIDELEVGDVITIIDWDDEEDGGDGEWIGTHRIIQEPHINLDVDKVNRIIVCETVISEVPD